MTVAKLDEQYAFISKLNGSVYEHERIIAEARELVMESIRESRGRGWNAATVYVGISDGAAPKASWDRYAAVCEIVAPYRFGDALGEVVAGVLCLPQQELRARFNSYFSDRYSDRRDKIRLLSNEIDMADYDRYPMLRYQTDIALRRLEATKGALKGEPWLIPVLDLLEYDINNIEEK